MVYIPDFDNIELPTSEEITANKAAIDAEIAEWRQQQLVNAWEELQAVPSYVEQQARAFSQEETL